MKCFDEIKYLQTVKVLLSRDHSHSVSCIIEFEMRQFGGFVLDECDYHLADPLCTKMLVLVYDFLMFAIDFLVQVVRCMQLSNNVCLRVQCDSSLHDAC
jgi:hypothetical protein